MYLQGLWTLLTFVLLISGLSINILIVPILGLQLIAYMKTLDKTPKKYWLIYFFLNYVMAIVQVYAVLRSLFVNDGSFYKTNKKRILGNKVR